MPEQLSISQDKLEQEEKALRRKIEEMQHTIDMLSAKRDAIIWCIDNCK